MRYVCITTGAGAWTNKAISLHLAKKKAGIHNMDLEMISSVPSGPVEIIQKSDLFKKAVGKTLKCFGINEASQTRQQLSACVGVLPTNPAIFDCGWSDNKDPKYILSSVGGGLIRTYEDGTKDQAVKPYVGDASIKRRDKPWIAVCAVAIILEDQVVPSDLDYDKKILESIQRFE